MTWTTAAGTTEASTSNLQNNDVAAKIDAVVGNRNNLEVSASGSVTANAAAEYTMGQEAPVQSGVMATVKSNSGGAIYGRNPTGQDTVDIGGTRTSIDVAVGMGLLVRNGDGSFSDIEKPVALKDPRGASKGESKAETPKAETDGLSFGDEADGVMQELLGSQNPGDLFKTMDSVLLRGDVDKGTIERMASMAGVEPHEMHEKVATVWRGAYDNAMDIMSEAGVTNEDGFEAFLADNPRIAASMSEAARNYFAHHKTEGLQTMAGEFLAQADKYDTDNMRNLLTEAGWEYQEAPDGGLQVMVNGTPVSWEVAVKQQIITFSPA